MSDYGLDDVLRDLATVSEPRSARDSVALAHNRLLEHVRHLNRQAEWLAVKAVDLGYPSTVGGLREVARKVTEEA